jgi:hypothetical protein
MRLESLIAGAVILALGIVLVATNGVLFGVNLPGLIGLPSCSSSPGSQNTTSVSFGCGFYAPSTIVCLFGLGLIGNGFRGSSSYRPGRSSASGGEIPSDMLAAHLQYAQQNLAAMSAATAAQNAPVGSRFCPECGKANGADAKFCQGCGRTMPPPTPPPTTVSPAAPPPSSGGSPGN